MTMVVSDHSQISLDPRRPVGRSPGRDATQSLGGEPTWEVDRRRQKSSHRIESEQVTVSLQSTGGCGG